MMRGLLEIIAIGPDDAIAAERGGADRLEVVTAMEADGLSPQPRVVETLRRRCDLPLRVMVRTAESFETSPAELDDLATLIRDYVQAGADGFVFGFLTSTLEVDVHAAQELAQHLNGLPWTFHRAIDHALDTDRAWQRIRDLAGLDAVLTAGSARDVEAGLNELTRRARADQEVASRLLAGGGLRPDHVPWLAQSGVRGFHVGTAVRPDQTFKAYVDPGYVRSWRTLVDEEVARAEDLGPARS